LNTFSTEPFAPVSGGLRLRIHARPGAKRDAIEGFKAEADGGTALKVAVRVKAEAGQANAAIVKLLAGAWKLPRADFSLLVGATDRRKLFHLAGEPQALLAKLEEWRRQWTERP
jgi:uncharacterized protein